MNDIVCYNVINVDKAGVTLKYQNSDLYVRFEECAKNYAIEKTLKVSNCVATRDVTELTFSFYTLPKTKVIFKKSFLRDLFSGKSAVNQFFQLQKAICQYGYSTYDLS